MSYASSPESTYPEHESAGEEEIIISAGARSIPQLAPPPRDKLAILHSLFGILPSTVMLEEARAERLARHDVVAKDDSAGNAPESEDLRAVIQSLRGILPADAALEEAHEERIAKHERPLGS